MHVCAHVCVASVAQFVREHIWRMQTSGTLGHEFKYRMGTGVLPLHKELTRNLPQLYE